MRSISGAAWEGIWEALHWKVTFFMNITSSLCGSACYWRFDNIPIEVCLLTQIHLYRFCSSRNAIGFLLTALQCLIVGSWRLSFLQACEGVCGSRHEISITLVVFASLKSIIFDTR